jgi:protein subunit release factor A
VEMSRLSGASLLTLCGCAAAWVLPPPLPPRFAARRGCREGTPVCMADGFVLSRLAEIKSSYDELMAKLEDPEIMADTSVLLQVTKDRAKLEPTVEAYDKYMSLTEQLAEAKEMFNEADDAEMKELAREEQKECESALAELDEELKLLLLPSDPNDEKNVMFEIRAGTGGDEAAIWASDLLKLYKKYADGQGWQTRVVSMSDSDVRPAAAAPTPRLPTPGCRAWTRSSLER